MSEIHPIGTITEVTITAFKTSQIRSHFERSSSCLVLSVILCSLSYIQSHADDCRGNATPAPAETFKEGDEPYTITVGDNKFSTPYGYGREANAGRKYPLVVIGKWGEGNRYFNEDIRKTHPSFYLEFQQSSDTDGARLAGIIGAACEKGLRIDVNRILYTGFSAGGSGSFKLVRGMAGKGKYFAGLNRVAGQSESVMAETATGRTALWLHIGLKDVPKRVEVSRELYQNLKKHPVNAGAIETHVSDTVKDPNDTAKDVPRNTWILTKNGVEIVRYSEYPTCAHDAWIGYADPYMFEWIFGREMLEMDRQAESKLNQSGKR
ncbi:MAG: hypothetical protein GXX96_02265 [Planctomycetaceae bacterium]|nr:hypothetical protein [Planctomycetaceae bacterium]